MSSTIVLCLFCKRSDDFTSQDCINYFISGGVFLKHCTCCYSNGINNHITAKHRVFSLICRVAVICGVVMVYKFSFSAGFRVNTVVSDLVLVVLNGPSID